MGWVKQGNNFFVLNTNQIFPLENKVYMVNFNSSKGFFLTEKEPFKIPSKIYGDNSVIYRWKKSWENNSEKNMGIILSGLKGTGKTITAQLFCQLMNLPVILINRNWNGPDFIDFITTPDFGEAIIFIDEFEKIYNDNNDSLDLLSIMDGNYPTKLIFLFTVNEFKINEYLINRLNRIKYRNHYYSLDKSVIDDVIDDLLIYKEYRESIHSLFNKLGLVTFDLLTNVIKEINLFNEDAFTVGKYLNLKVEDIMYDIYEILDDKEYIVGRNYHINFYDEDIKEKIIEVMRKPDNPNYDTIKIDDEEEEYDGRYGRKYFDIIFSKYDIIEENKVYILKNKDSTFKFKQSRSKKLFF